MFGRYCIDINGTPFSTFEGWGDSRNGVHPHRSDILLRPFSTQVEEDARRSSWVSSYTNEDRRVHRLGIALTSAGYRASERVLEPIQIQSAYRDIAHRFQHVKFIFPAQVHAENTCW